MNKELKFTNIVATDGFQFSGSGLINDILKANGYVAPKNVRLDEFLISDSNFSWPRALDNDYDSREKLRIIIGLIKTIAVRFPINLMQRTFLYRFFLKFNGRGVLMHEPTSVNRSIWSYVLSIFLLVQKAECDEKLFVKWFGLKYKFCSLKSKDLLLDNGIPSHMKLLNWFFNLGHTMGIIVYRNPRIQYQQIVQVKSSQGKGFPTYEVFLTELLKQYELVVPLFESDYPVVPVFFDGVLNDEIYRSKFESILRDRKILKDINYDFNQSVKNNNDLVRLAEVFFVSSVCLEKEEIVKDFHHKFYLKFESCLSPSA